MKQCNKNTNALLNLVGLVYEAVSETSPWLGFADRLRQVLGAKAVSVTLHNSPEMAQDIQVVACKSDDKTDWVAIERIYHERFSHIEQLQPKRVKPGQVIRIEPSMLGKECAEYLAALGIQGSIRTCFSEPLDEMRCWIDIIYEDEAASKAFYKQAAELLNLLLPHLTRALSLYVKLQRQEAELGMYASSLDHLSLGCLMLDAQSRVLSTNQVAKDIINEHYGLAILNRQLILHDKSSQDEFNQAVENAIVSRYKPASDNDERLIRVELPSGRLLGILVSPALVVLHYQGKRTPSVNVYLAELGNVQVTSSSDEYRSIGVSVARLFGLTPQEGRLALLLSAGRSIIEAAELLGVAESAARNYSKNIYAKLDIRGQSDLVRLVCKSFALLR